MRDNFKSAIEYALSSALAEELKTIFREEVQTVVREHEAELRALVRKATLEALSTNEERRPHG